MLVDELYNECDDDLNLSLFDFMSLTSQFVANGGGSRDEFLKWVNSLTYDEVCGMLYTNSQNYFG